MSDITKSNGGDGMKNFMGGLFAVLSLPVALVSGAVAGAVRSIDRGSLDEFGKGFEETADKVVNSVEEFGKEHGPGMVATVAAIVVGGAINKSFDGKE